MKARTGPPITSQKREGAPRPAPRQPQRPTDTRPAHRSARDHRRFWWAALAALVVIVGLSIAFAAGGGGGNSSGKLEVAKSVKVDGSALPVFADPTSDPAVGRTAPGLSGQDFDRKPVTIANNGNPHVLVFVAHWCPHCQTEIPRVVDMERAGQTAGVAVTAVATGTNENSPNYPPSAWLQREHWPYPTLVDTSHETAARAYGLSAYPYLVFVDANGRVAARVTGEVDPSDLAKMFSALAAGRTVPIPGSAAASAG